MSKMDYEIVAIEGGWAYVIADVCSKVFPTKQSARAAADRAARTALSGLSGDVAALERQRRARDEKRN